MTRVAAWRSVAMVLVLGTTGWAGSTLDLTLGSLSPNAGVVWDDYLSGSWAIAGNDATFQDVYQYLPQANTAANAAVIGANAVAVATTQPGSVAAAAFATAGPGSSAAYAYADQRIWFTTSQGSDLQIDLTFTVAQSLSAGWNEAAFADASIGLSLYREGGVLDSMADDALVDESAVYIWNSADAGNSLSEQFSDMLSVLGSFSPGEVGYVWLSVDGQAVAVTIPAPSAMLLGMTGACLVGFLRCRFLWWG